MHEEIRECSVVVWPFWGDLEASVKNVMNYAVLAGENTNVRAKVALFIQGTHV